MPDDSQDAKAQKLAAARKKLKEYQQRNNNNSNTSHTEAASAGNLLEHPTHPPETNVNGSPGEEGQAPIATTTAVGLTPDPEDIARIAAQNGGRGIDSNLQAIQVIIEEKTQLSAELAKCRLACRERELEMEELRIQHTQASQRVEQLLQRCQEQSAQAEQERRQSAQFQAQIEDQKAHLSELEAQVKQSHELQAEIHRQLAEKTNELEMSQIRLRQLSDESNISADNRVETLTKTQFMYEQQIRDLQAMVSQLTKDKEQAATQYQNYVQHQGNEIAKLKETNAEINDSLIQLRERERQLVEHVGGLERDIQKNLSLQAQFKEQQKEQEQETTDQTTTNAELASLRERISDFDFERHEFQLKIKSQDDQLQMKDAAIAELEQQLGRLETEQPDQAKLLATMESDKVAASRALSQNVEMKKQLDELELKFVQLTNDKAELVIKLDAEEFANREMRLNYASMEQKLQANEDRFKFKDEEMIRLSHENVELKQQLDEADHHHHHHEIPKEKPVETSPEQEHAHSNDHDHDHDHNHEHSHNCQDHDHDEPSKLEEGKTDTASPGCLPSAEAVEKLQSRFTTLINQVADLTDEKHNLEHLVLQLQGETETIGEYIALYQTQRRMLKQREYEKATQMRLLQAEREQLRDKIDSLNQLVTSLGVDLPPEQGQLAENAQNIEESVVLSSSQGESGNSQQIINKIQDIITEIKENTEQPPTALSSNGHAVDHFNCCLGKFEVV
ncbi:uncharacterized protein Dwil_GK21914 [Drosophila willistoni]|uniref:GK21914 n=1 Tax=Drosophila willistoni TaxID=7260 RepID=B4MQP4_DROWI|nr:golgin subfamily A member 2 [Drosophila willistoni]EDW74433.1 uncharacterized protein Dwil_GK21914 [Drosophila willistoni]